MRIIVVGEKSWYEPELAEAVLSRLLARYGPSLTIVHRGEQGTDRAFVEACSDAGIEQEAHRPLWRRLDHPDRLLRHDKHKIPYNANAPAIRDREMISRGGDMCLVVHRTIRLAKDARDCVKLALEAGIPTYLIEDESATPRRIGVVDLL